MESEDVDVVALDTYRRNVDDVARLGERVHAVSVGKVLGALEFLASFGRSVKIESRDGETTLVIDYPEGEALTVTDTSLAACIGLIQEHGTKESKP